MSNEVKNEAHLVCSSFTFSLILPVSSRYCLIDCSSYRTGREVSYRTGSEHRVHTFAICSFSF